jgi:hypothetical protein
MSLTILALAAIISVFAKSGAMTPFIAGGLGIAYGTATHADYQSMLSAVILFYFTAYFANTWAESENKSMTTMFNINAGAEPLGLMITKLITLMIFALLPIPKPAFYVQGLLAILVAVTLFCMNSALPAKYMLSVMFIQWIIFLCLGGLFNYFSNYESYSMALIAAVAIPNLINPSQNVGHYSPYEDGANVGPLSLAGSFLLTYLTPGYSSNVITKSIFLPGLSQSIAGTLLDSAVEGWAIHIALTNQITTKAVLGDLLSLPQLEWSTFTPYNSLKLVMISLPILAAIVVMFTPALNVDLPVFIPCLLIALQSTLTCGFFWTILFIAAGVANHYLSGFPDKSYTGFIFMSQV